MTEAWIIDAVRTPRGIGKKGKGSLSNIHPQMLGAAVLKAIAERNQLNTAEVDDIVWGTSRQVGSQGCDLGRMAALSAGYDMHSSAVTIDRFCGSGITTVTLAAGMIMSGLEDLVVAGGTEVMSSYDVNNSTNPDAQGMVDAGNFFLRDIIPQPHQGVAADAIASLEKISREDLDALAYSSQQRAATAIAEGRFDRSLISVFHEDGSVALDHEEFPRPTTTLESLAGLPPAFEAIADFPLDDSGRTFRQMVNQVYPELTIEHVHHAGNSSGVVDGAAAILMASPDYAKAHGMTPRARIVASANIGDDPTLMLNAPVPAAKKVLAKAGMSVSDIDLFEINEAFAVVAEKFQRDLDLDRDKVNVNGGAMALGHPIGATGAILIGTALDELERQDKQFGLITMCAAGGMAPAVIIERI